jgi:hypothetical protein
MLNDVNASTSFKFIRSEWASGNKYRLIVVIHYNRKRVLSGMWLPMRSTVGAVGGIVMPATLIRETHAAYRRFRRFVPLGVLRSEKDYRKPMAMLDEIIDEIGQDEAHPLADLAEALALFIHSYEETHAKIRESTRIPVQLQGLLLNVPTVQPARYKYFIVAWVVPAGSLTSLPVTGTGWPFAVIEVTAPNRQG